MRLSLSTFLFASFLLQHGLLAWQADRATPSDLDRQRPTTRQAVEDAAFEFTMASAELGRYMAYVRGEEEENQDDGASAREFEAVFALMEGKQRSDRKQRFDMKGSWIFSRTEAVRESNERALLVDRHHWIERHGYVVDVFDVDPDVDPFTDVHRFDPLTMPLEYATSLQMNSSKKEIVNLMMPVGKLFDSERLADGKLVGRWWHGRQKTIGVTEVIFDPSFGGNPVDFRIYIRKPGQSEVDKGDPEGTTRLYQRNQTQWSRHSSGRFLPREVSCEQFYPYLGGWRLSMEWWIDDEVPNEIFELDDLKLGRTGSSKLDKMVSERKEKNRKRLNSSEQSP